MTKTPKTPSANVELPRLTLLATLISAALLVPNLVTAGSFTYTNDADWDLGVYSNTNSGPPGSDDQVQLNPAILTPFSNLWVAASGRGTIVKIDTNHQDADGFVSLTDSAAGNGAVLGEYRTAPAGMRLNPSRTTVDANGDVWVGNRDESSGGLGSVAKVSATPTGVTSSGLWNDGANGGASGTFNALAWTNAGGTDTSGGTSTATDTANLLYVRTAGTNVRTIAVDQNNDVWVGGYGDKEHQKYDGTTGAAVSAIENFGSNSGYGGLIDANGVLWSAGWSSRSLSRYDPATDIETNPVVGGGSYGLAADTNGNIYNTHLSTTLTKLDSAGNQIWFKNYGGQSGGRGIAVTPSDNNLWIANSFGNTVTRLDSDGNLIATITVGSGPTGVAVDSNGKVWVTNRNSSTVSRINPATNLTELTVDLGSGASPYNYSDMTGTGLATSLVPTGVWRDVLDGGSTGVDWDRLFWNTEAEGSIPDGTSIVVELRAANALADLASAAWQSFLSGDSLAALSGRYMEVRATMTRQGGADALSPVLSDLRITTLDDGQVPEPGTLSLMGIALASLAGLRRRRRLYGNAE